MIVEITPPGEHRRQFVVIELQGLVQARKGERLDGQTLGTLRFKQGKPTMIIGNQEATGKIEPLAKPHAVMVTVDGRRHRARPAASASSSASAPASADVAADVHDSRGIRMEVVGLATKRIVFGTRPRPIVTGVIKPAA